jgi:hypothetical protein
LSNVNNKTYYKIEGVTGKRHDIILLRDSDITNRFKEEQVDDENQYIIMGDSAYIPVAEAHLTSYLDHESNKADYVNWNRCMKHVRISIEWNYGTTGTLFKYTRRKEKFKLMKSRSVSMIYTVATLFRNFHVMIYGGQSSNYFNLCMPKNMVEHYINQVDF